MLLQFRTMRSNLLLQWIYGKEFVVKYISLTLAEVERDWTTQEKEAFAMVWAFETYRPYIIGYTFTIETDHESLVWLKKATKPPKLVRWACRLAAFDFQIKHRPGKENSNADALSRLPVHDTDTATPMRNSMIDYNLMDMDVEELETIVKPAYLFDRVTKEELRIRQRNDLTFFDLIEHCDKNNG